MCEMLKLCKPYTEQKATLHPYGGRVASLPLPSSGKAEVHDGDGVTEPKAAQGLIVRGECRRDSRVSCLHAVPTEDKA